mgnify:FL=1
MKKRLLSMILALSMMLTFLPLSVFAGTTNGNYGSGVTWTLTQNNADSNHPTYCLTISSDGTGTGKMTDEYTENGVPWHNVCTQITQVEVTAGVTSIGDYAFYGCSNLATVALPEGITSIGEQAFSGCEGLTAIRIPSSVQAIGRYAFYECINLATVENLENSKITKIEEGTFSTQYRYPTRLTSIAFPENLSEIGEDAFHGAGLVKITFPEKVTSIGSEAFRSCTKLTTVEGFDNLKLSIVSNHIFGDCKALSSIKIPDTVTTIENGAFSGCKSLTTIAIPEKVTLIEGNVFNDCENLTSVEGFDKLKISSIGSYTFCGCKNLSSITLPNTVKKIDTYAFWQCYALSTITIPENVTSIGFHAFDACSGLATVVLPKNVPSIGEGAFYGNNENLKIQYPYSKKDWLAQGCTSAKISSLQNDGITILYDSNIIKPIPICYYCSVNFNPNGGTFTDGTTDTKVVSNIYRTENIPEKVQNENKITNPTKSGYTFVGWTLEKDNASTQVDPANISKNITGSRFDGITDDGMTFYALYTVAPKPATVTISGPTDNTVKAGEGSDVFTVAADKGDTDAAKAKFDFAGGKVQYRTGDTGEWFDLTSNELSIDDLTGKQFRVVPDADAVTAQKTLTVKLMDAGGNEIAGATASTTFAVTARKPAEVTITGLDGTTVKAGEAKDFTVSVTPNDDTINKVTFGTTSGEVQWSSDNGNTWTTVSGDVDYSELTGKKFRVVPAADAADGTVTVTITAKKAGGTEIAKTASFTVTAREHATVKINELNGKTIKQNKAYTFTVTVTAHDDGEETTLKFDNVAGLTYNNATVTDAGVTVTLTKNQSEPLNFTLTPSETGSKSLTATLSTSGATDTATYTVSEYEHAKVTIDGLGTDLKQGESKDFTVKVDPKDDSGNAIIDFGDKNSEIQYKDGEDWKPMPPDGLKINLNNGEKPYDFRITPKNDGSQTLTATVKQNDNELGEVEQTYTVAKKNEPTTPGGGENPGGGSTGGGENPGGGSTGGSENPGENPGGGSTGGSENPGENPGGGSTGDSGNTKPTPKPDEKPDRKIKIDGGIVEVNGKEVKPDEDGNITVKKGDEITVTVDKSKISDAQVFDQWVIKPDSVLNEVDPKSEKISFTMPAEDVTIEAMTRDASIEDDGPGILGTGALIATGVVGSAALLYQGHMLGTELYLRYLLPHGAVIPQNRAELAVLLWQDAENPEPVSTTLYSDISDEDSAIQQAARWAVENDLMEQLDAEEHPDHFDPFVPVTFSDSIRAWKKAQELKKSVH